MRLPAKPPDILPILQQTPPERLARIVSTTGMLVAGKYIHWDNLRHRKPPEGLTHAEWWLGVRMPRLSARENMPFATREGNQFSLVHAAPIRRGLHQIDQKLGMSGPRSDVRDMVHGHGKKHLLANAIVEEAIRSSQLEGASTTRAMAKDMIRAGRKPETRGERMILNNYHAIERIGELAKRDLTRADIFELHGILMNGTLADPTKAGKFRTDADSVVVTLVNSEQVAHVLPLETELPTRMDQLLAFANERSPDEWLHPVIRAIIVHFMIGYDHPFVNGNGRVARALFYWSMVRQGYDLARYLAVSTILRRAPAKYSRAYLHTETDNGDLTYFVDYHIRVINRSIDALARHVQKKMSDMVAIEDRLKDSQHLNHRQIRLLRHALRHPGFRYTVQSHATSHGVSTNTARSDLLKLANAELLALSRRGRRHDFIAPLGLEEAIEGYRRKTVRRPGAGRAP